MNGFNVRRIYSLIDKREQYARNWSIRINHLNVPPRLIERLGLSLAVMHTAYQRIIAPVLHKVLQNWNLHEFGVQGVPALLDLLENGHFLGKKCHKICLQMVEESFLEKQTIKYAKAYL